MQLNHAMLHAQQTPFDNLSDVGRPVDRLKAIWKNHTITLINAINNFQKFINDKNGKMKKSNVETMQ